MAVNVVRGFENDVKIDAIFGNILSFAVKHSMKRKRTDFSDSVIECMREC